MNLKSNPVPRSSLSFQQKSQNLNLNILNLLTKPKQQIIQSNQSKNIPNLSLNDLSQILKQKNHKLQEYKHQRQQVRDWLKDKGINVKKIQQEVKNSIKVAEEIQTVILQKKGIKELTKEQVNLLTEKEKKIYLDALETEKLLTKVKWSFKPQTQEQFITQKQQQNAVNLTILKSSNLKDKNKTQHVLLSKIKKIRPNSNFNFNNINNSNNETNINKSPKIQVKNESQKYSYKQNSLKRSKYFQFVQQLCVNGFNQSILSKLKPINSFWQIILTHINTLQHFLKTHHTSQPHHNQSTLYSQISTLLSIQSLHLLQQKYSQSLPDFLNIRNNNINNLKYQFKHLQQKYKNLFIYRNQQGQPIWAMVYYLLRANKMVDLRKVLKNVDNVYIEELIKYQESIEKGQPKASVKGFDLNKYRDKFYKQIIFILKAIPKFQAEINDIDSLNKIWIILRTLAIYRYIPQKDKQYNQILEGFFQKQIYTTKSISKSSIQQYLYLIAYKQTLRFCQININRRKLEFSQDFNNDDYFHFVMIVTYYPQLCGDMNQAQINQMKQKFVQFLLKYIQLLFKQQQYKAIPSYLLLSPPQQLEQTAIKFINTRDKYLKFSWSTLKQLLLQRDQQNGLQTYEQLRIKILNNLKLSTFYDYKFIIQQYKTRFYKQKQSKLKEQEYSVMILMKKLYFIEKKKFYMKINCNNNNGDIQMQKWTQELMVFFEIQNQNKLQQKQIQLVREVKRCQQLLQYKRSSLKNEKNDIQYYKKVTMPYEFYRQFVLLNSLIQSRNIRQLKKFTPSWFINSQLVHIRDKKPNPTPIFLLELFTHPSTQQLISLYIYYIICLIKSQQIICLQQCDYYSLNNFKRLVLHQLINLQNYHEDIIKKSQSSLFQCVGWAHVMKNKYPQLQQYQQQRLRQNNEEFDKIRRKIYKNPFINCEEEKILIKQLENQWANQ